MIIDYIETIVLIFRLKLSRLFLKLFMEHLLQLKFFAQNMLECRVTIEKFILEVFDIYEKDFAFLSIYFHWLHPSIFLEDNLFNTNYLWIVYIWEYNLLSIASSEFIYDS